MSLDVTAVVNLHQEGPLCVPSLRSAEAAVAVAKTHGIACELLILLDRPDERTRQTARAVLGDRARYAEADAGDLGLARNAAVDASGADAIAFLDSDDLWGDEWLWAAHRCHANQRAAGHGPAVWHPELTVLFGGDDAVYHHLPSTHPLFDEHRFRMHNSWTALCFGARSIFHETPYPPNRLEIGFGYEDWSWNEELLRIGVSHDVVPDTCHFVARKQNPRSLMQRTSRALRTPYRTR